MLSGERLADLLSTPDRPTRIGKRDVAILELLELFFSTRLRLEELRQSNRNDVSRKTRDNSTSRCSSISRLGQVIDFHEIMDTERILVVILGKGRRSKITTKCSAHTTF